MKVFSCGVMVMSGLSFRRKHNENKTLLTFKRFINILNH